ARRSAGRAAPPRSARPAALGARRALGRARRPAPAGGALDRVPPELVAQRGQHAIGEVAVAARAKARVQRRRDHRRRHVVLGRVGDRPAALARVLCVALDRLQLVAVGFERARRQFAQPRTYDRALAPEVGDLGVVELVLALVEQVEALGVGLHQAVLDAVVDHLHVVTRAGRAEVHPAALADRWDALLGGLGRQHVEDRRQSLDGFRWPADHHAVADLEPPHAAGDADVDVFDALAFELLGAALVVGPTGVAAVDDRVAAIEQLGQLVDSLLRGRAGRDHDPHDPRRRELLDELSQRARAGGPVPDRLPDGLLVEVEGDDLVLGVAPDAVHHVAAHLAQPDKADLCHLLSPRAFVRRALLVGLDVLLTSVAGPEGPRLDPLGQLAQRGHRILAAQTHALGR